MILLLILFLLAGLLLASEWASVLAARKERRDREFELWYCGDDNKKRERK